MSDFYYYTNPNDILHYGVKGMKWGVRRYEKQKAAVSKLQKKRKDIYEKHGAASNSYMNVSKKLYLQKSKARYQKAKLDKDPTEITIQKANIRNAKHYKKHGTADADGQDDRRVYGQRLSRKEMEAVRLKEWDKTRKQANVKKVASVVTPIAISAGIAYFNKNSSKIGNVLYKKGIDINVVNKGINFVNKFADIIAMK